MGGQWGVNRSVAQIQALLFVSERPLTAEEIADQLGLARSNVSTSLKELLGWRLIRRVPVPGDRRDHFEAETDIWEIVTRIAEGRKRRDIDPAAAVLRTCVEQAEGDGRVGATALARLRSMLEFVAAADRWYGQMAALPRTTLAALLKMGAKVAAVLKLAVGGARRKPP